MAAGVADITCESVGTLAPFTNLANIDIMPYIYNGYDHFQAVWGGELGQEILDTVGNPPERPEGPSRPRYAGHLLPVR